MGIRPEGTTEPWEFYAPGNTASDLVDFEAGNGYWVYVSSAFEFIVPSPRSQSYHYDSDGRREGSVVIYDGEDQIAKYDDLGEFFATYFQGPGNDKPISMIRDGQTYYYHSDALGSVTELTDSSGSVVQSYRYGAFGELIQKSGNISNPFTFTGREYDEETQLYYYRARYYDASLGRFLSADSFGDISSSYAYVNNSPPQLS